MDKAGFGVVVIVNGREDKRREEDLKNINFANDHDLYPLVPVIRKTILGETQEEMGLCEKVKELSVGAGNMVGALLYLFRLRY